VCAIGFSQPRGNCGELPGIVFGAFDLSLRELGKLVLFAELLCKNRMPPQWLSHRRVVPSPEERPVECVVGADDLEFRVGNCAIRKGESYPTGILIGGPVHFLTE